MNQQEEFEILSWVVAQVGLAQDPLPSGAEWPPIISFEGLPGSGKSTQIQRVASLINENFGKALDFDLPSMSGVGLPLKSLYRDKDNWPEVRVSVPWLNPLLLMVDLYKLMLNALRDGIRVVLMSRGLVSTYYYNIDAYEALGFTFEEAWVEMSNLCRPFVAPRAIFILDIPIKTARERIIKRNRLPLRAMDEEKGLLRNQRLFREILSRIDPAIPVHHIDAKQTEEHVTRDIYEAIKIYVG